VIEAGGRPGEVERARSRRALMMMLAVVLPALVVSGIGPYERITWWLEVAPVIIAVPVLLATFRRFPLTPLLYALIGVHAVILMYGGHYTYARTPLGFWVQDLFDLARNHYDRLGHLAQGFVPAMVAREILLRTSPLGPKGWLPFLVVCVCMAISVSYEFIEWWAALIGGIAAEDFLGTQGDVWDTQWDMFLATCGAVLALVSLAGVHDRQLARLLRG
jgi:putative membrane protein